MKPIYLSLLLLSALVGRAQTKTIPVIMQVSDTAIHKIKHHAGEVYGQTSDGGDIINAEDYTEYLTDSTIWWIRGYEVIIKSDQNNYLDNAVIVSVWNPGNPGYAHLKYLDANKKPLKYFVWLSKSIP